MRACRVRKCRPSPLKTYASVPSSEGMTISDAERPGNARRCAGCDDGQRAAYRCGLIGTDG